MASSWSGERHHARRSSLTKSTLEPTLLPSSRVAPRCLGDLQTSFGILGNDFAGIVLAVGSEAQGVTVGDSIHGATNAMSAYRPDAGAFGQYHVSAGPVWLKLPVSLSTEAGASLWAGLSTAGLGPLVFHCPMCQWQSHRKPGLWQ